MSKADECEYCREKDNAVNGKSVRNFEWEKTSGYINTSFDYLEMFILKGTKDNKAGLMLYNSNGARYVDISYCPFCGRKLGE